MIIGKRKLKTKITFEVSKNKTYVSVIRGAKQIGHIWSQQDDLTTPYPHDETMYCLNSIQICGFDKISQIWTCGPFEGKKDCVVHFIPTDNQWIKEKGKEYSEYVKNFFKAETKILETGKEKFTVTKVNVKDGKVVTKLLSFKEWLDTGGCL